ncbi:MAG: molybdenum cofactor guanylyltransferase MobA [Pseudomonadota bacterium]
MYMPPPSHLEITGIVLAGGKSRRMGGGDKGGVEVAGKPMLQHIVDRFRPQVGRLAINANGDAKRFAAYGLDVFPDATRDYPGPLAGILAGMVWAGKNTPKARWIASVPIDIPLLPLDLIARLRAACAANPVAVAIAGSNGRLHPVIGLWPIGFSGDLAAALENGVRKVQHWTSRHHAIAVDFPAVEIAGRCVDPFFNVNTPQDLAALRTLLTAEGSLSHRIAAGAD